MPAHPSREDLVAFALGALDPVEVRPVADHVPDCANCTRELEALAPAVAALGESVEQLSPPPELRGRVLAVVRREAAARTPEPEPRRRQRPALARLLPRPAAGLVAVAAIAAGVAGYLIADDDDDGAAATTVAVVPEATRAGGTLELGEDSSTLRLQGMRQLTGNDVYQTWIAQGSSLRASSSFLPDQDGTATAEVDSNLGPGTKVMVTREPRPGHTTPTLPVLLSATVQ
jgi:hypothetical protein